VSHTRKKALRVAALVTAISQRARLSMNILAVALAECGGLRPSAPNLDDSRLLLVDPNGHVSCSLFHDFRDARYAPSISPLSIEVRGRSRGIIGFWGTTQPQRNAQFAPPPQNLRAHRGEEALPHMSVKSGFFYRRACRPRCRSAISPTTRSFRSARMS
jgi:hypothetical protein